MQFSAVERVRHYIALPAEEDAAAKAPPPPEAWPTAGRIEWRSVVSRYLLYFIFIININIIIIILVNVY